MAFPISFFSAVKTEERHRCAGEDQENQCDYENRMGFSLTLSVALFDRIGKWPS